MDNLVNEFLEQFTIADIIAYGVIALRILLIVAIGVFISKFIRVGLKKLILNEKIHPVQGKTTISILESTIKYFISFVAILMILVVLEIDITPILTSAGILGFAIGFGSQNLVRDIISGFFVIFEGQFHVGDFVEINGGKIRGTVEEIGLRVTKIREWSMKLNYIPNGEIKLVNNYSRGKMRPIIDVTVPYGQDVKHVYKVLERTCYIIAENYKEYLVEDPKVLGITDIEQKGITFTLMAVTDPDSYWLMGREIRKHVLLEFKNSGVDVAYPHRVIVNSRDSENIAEGLQLR
ncbi:mechanosensitive ion channel family protein [Alkalicella caledoniensis]|uniref:Mechanosensitive ion channel family protein n=1 Tax=Alkalicella caledoniensis TaxID=2731377 RepID=A0A7G9W772_ALKCA|nr:mechanosensitive ion channel family protein [Alkalicella caledoniensis]QNO14534.1 mechanosensitive ion channel family protein [Alkalicella caledoniensis]